MEAKLLVVGGEVKTKEVRLRLPSVIGRGKGSNIVLPHPLVSRKHCELTVVGDKIVVRDLGSLNGTYVNNERIADEMTIEPGQLLTIGSVTFRLIYGSGSPSNDTGGDTEDWVPSESGESRATAENLAEELAAQAGGTLRAGGDDEPSVPSFGGPLFTEEASQGVTKRTRARRSWMPDLRKKSNATMTDSMISCAALAIASSGQGIHRGDPERPERRRT